MSNVVVRPATEQDLSAAAALAGQLARLHHDTDPERFFLPDNVVEGYTWWFKRELARNGAVILVAEASTAGGAPLIVGYAYGALGERDWNLLLDEHGAVHDIYVADGERRSGVGALLLAAMLAALERLGAPRIVLSTMPTNLAAQRLFARHGFRATFIEMTRNTARGA